MTPSPPASPPPDNDNDAPIDLEDDVPEEQKPREAPASLATRFKSLCRASPPPDTASGPPVPTSRPHVLPRPNVRATVPTVPFVNRSSRGMAVRSCDQCRTSKQKCDRNQPCSTCTMRKIKCSWSQAGLAPPGPLAQQVMENRAEIARLRHEANVLAKILRLTPVDFDLFHREAQRLADGGRGHPVQLPPMRGMKRPRSFDIHAHERTEPPSKAHRRHEDRSPHRADPARSPHRSPVRHADQVSRSPSRTKLPFPAHYRPIASDHGVNSPSTSRSQNPSATSSRTAPTTTSPTPIPPRPLPQSRYSFSTLPPLTIPSPSVSRPSTGLPPRPAHLTPHPSTTASPRRRPHYVLPTPIYSSTPTSASFFPLSSTKSHSKPWPLFPPYETKTISPRVQPYTPLSAVRDEKPKIEKEEDDNDDIIIVKFDPRPSSKSSEAKESHKEVSPPRKVAPTLKNLLND